MKIILQNPMRYASIVFLLLASAHNTHAYTTQTTTAGKTVRWNSTSTTMRLSQDSFPSGDAYRAALDLVVDRLNKNPSKFNYNLSYGDTSVSKGNEQNEIWFSSASSELGGSPAVTWSWWWTDSGDLDETDIVFDEGRVWTAGFFKSVMTPYGGSSRPFWTTSIHELGHAFGLDHLGDKYNIMGQDWDHIYANWIFALGYLGEDASNGAVALYGSASTSIEDLSVVHWRWTGTSSGGYSKHDRTRILDSGGSEQSKVSGESEPRYRVDNGETVQLEFTYENNGSHTQTIDVGFYLSTNDLITTSDRRIGGASIILGRNDVWTTTHTVTLPADMDTNEDYYVGAVVDEEDVVDEGDWEGNNATYIGIRTSSVAAAPTPTPTFPIIVIRPTNTPTPIIVIRPTPTFPIIVIRPTNTPTPIIVIRPTPTPTLRFHIPDIILERDLFKRIPDPFIQRTVVLPDTFRLMHFDTVEQPNDVTPSFRFGHPSSEGASRGVTLPNRSVLTVAFRHEEFTPRLITIAEDGRIHDFGELDIPTFAVTDLALRAEFVTIIDMIYDGGENVDLLFGVTGSDTEQTASFEVVVRTTISGPFRVTAAEDYALH